MRKREPLGAAADDAAPQIAERRRADDAEERRPFGHQRDIDRVFVAPGDEFPRAVERVDQKVTAAHYRLRLFARGVLLRNDRHVRSKPLKTVADNGFGGFVGRGHRRAVRLALHVRRLGEIQDSLRRVRGDPGQRVHQIGACGGIEGWHGRFLAISAG